MVERGSGWELRVRRLGLQLHDGLARTYGSYSVSVDGKAQELTGYMCEATGPGDNSHAENGRRIEARSYPLSTQFHEYVSIGFSEDTEREGVRHMPAVLLTGTDQRRGILIHPAHPPKVKLYLSSIGCLNPTSPLCAADYMDFWDSRARVIAIIDSLRGFAPSAFEHEHNTTIPGAHVVIEGEPLDAWPDP